MVITKAKNFRPLSELNLMDNFLFHEMIAGREEGLAAGREEGILAFIKACYKLQCSDEFIIGELMSNFSLSQDIAQDYLDKSDKTS